MKYSIEELRTRYVVVPRTPTESMLENAWAEAHDEDAAGVWSSMIEAEGNDALPDILDLLEEGATIIEHLRKNIPRGWIVDWEDRINALLDTLKKERGDAS